MDDRWTHIDENAKAGYIDWLRGEGSRPAREIIDHVADCRACREEILELSELLDQQDVTSTKREPRKQRISSLLRIAAVFGGIVLVAIALYFLTQEDPSSDVQITEKSPSEHLLSEQDSLPEDSSFQNEREGIETPVIVAQHDTIRFASAFLPNPELEILVHLNFRSSEGALDVFKAAIPETLSRESEVILTWGAFSEDPDIRIVILDNTGTEVFSKRPEEKAEALDLSFPPGVYYWKLIQPDGLVGAGKFRLYSSAQ